MTEYELKRLSAKETIGERYKWKSMLRDRIQLDRLRPDTPMKNANVTLTRYSTRPPTQQSLALSFRGIVDGLLEYGIINSCANIIYKAHRSGKNYGRINIEVSC